MVTDTVCLSEELCATEVDFFAIKQGFRQSNDGIFGLAPRDSDEGPSLIKTMKTQGLIEKDMSSLWINEDGGKLTLGGSLLESAKSDWYSHKLIYNYDQCCSNPFWMIELQDIFLGKNSVIETK